MKIGPTYYATLAVIGIILFAIAYWKSKSKRSILLFFAVAGVTLNFDYAIYVLGKAYKYVPNVIEGKYDTHIGGLANGLILSSAGMLFAVYQRNWQWSIVLAGIFAGIEILFTKVGIYKPYWWEWWYTFFLLSIYFPIVRVWWNRLNRPRGAILSWISLMSTIYAIRISLAIVMYGIMQTRTYHVKWLESHGVDASAVNSPIIFIFALICTYFILHGVRRMWYLCVLIWFSILDYLMITNGLILVHRFDWLMFALANIITLLISIYLGRLLKESQDDFKHY